MNKFLVFFVLIALVSCNKDEATPDNNNNNSNNTFTEINSVASYDEAIKSGVSLMFYHATWCSICKAQRPSIESLLSDDVFKTVKFGQVDTDKNKDITTKYQVPGQPVIIIYKDGVEKHRYVGSGHSQQKLADVLKALL
jgi:thioredoxin 1